MGAATMGAATIGWALGAVAIGWLSVAAASGNDPASTRGVAVSIAVLATGDCSGAGIGITGALACGTLAVVVA
jgi:hypothetical protein